MMGTPSFVVKLPEPMRQGAAPPESAPRHRTLFLRSFVAGFAVLLPGVLLLSSALVRSPVGFRLGLAVAPSNDAFEFPGVPRAILDHSISAAAAKGRHEWFLYADPLSVPESGTGVRLRREPKLLREVFPGYPDAMASDEHLWTSYFSRPFDSAAYVPALGAERGIRLALSWQGCLDILRRYGADTLFLGNSETAEGVISSLLVPSGGGAPPRVLACVKSSAVTSMVRGTAGYLEELVRTGRQRPVSRVVVGYSLWWGARNADFESQEAVIQGALAHFPRLISEHPLWDRFLGLAGPSVLGAPQWEKLLPLNFELLRAQHRLVAPERYLSSGAGEVGDAGVGGIEIRDTELSRAAELFSRAKPYHSALEGMEPAVCRSWESITDDLDRTLGQLKRIARHVYVYLTPVTPLVTGAAPPCFVEGVKRILASRGEERVHVRVDDWDAYGLSWTDYLKPTWRPGILRVDRSHTNYEGARKVSRRLAAWIQGD